MKVEEKKGGDQKENWCGEVLVFDRKWRTL